MISQFLLALYNNLYRPVSAYSNLNTLKNVYNILYFSVNPYNDHLAANNVQVKLLNETGKLKITQLLQIYLTLPYNADLFCA